MPVVTGLYTLLLPPIAFAAFGSSRFLVVAADSATAAILAGGLMDMAPAGSPEYVGLAGTVALLTAGFLLLGRILKLGFLGDFLSQPVLTGFLAGVGVQVAIAVAGGMLGIETHSTRTIAELIEIGRRLRELHPLTPSISVAACLLMVGLHRVQPKIPGALLVVAAAAASSAAFHLSGRGVEILGPVAGGLPRLSLPAAAWSRLPSLISLAASCAVMIVAQSVATSRVYAARHQQTADANTDLAGLSAANAVAAFSGAFVVNGSPTQTAMAESAGAGSQLAQICTAGVVAAALLLLTRPLGYLPRCVLSSIVFLIALRLIDLRALRAIPRESPGEFLLGVATASAVLAAGVEVGIVLAMVISLLRVVRHSYHPRSGVLVGEGSANWRLQPIGPEMETESGLVIYCFAANLFYANASRFSGEILSLVGPSPSPVRWLVVDAEAITHLDYSAARTLEQLIRNLAARKVRMAFARVSIDLKSDLDRHELTALLEPDAIYSRLHDAEAAFHAQRANTAAEAPLP
jgi:MFS superfamily sulfate permease-like transporter